MRVQDQGSYWQCFRTKLQAEARLLITPHVRADADAICSSLAFAWSLEKLGYEAQVVLDEQPTSYYDFLPGHDQVEIYRPELADEAFDALLVLDCHEPSRLARRSVLWEKAENCLIIDHHQMGEEVDFLEDTTYWIESSQSSTSEMIYLLIREIEARTGEQLLDKDIAYLLAAGIYADTGGMRYSNTSSNTFLVMAALKQYDIPLAVIAEKLFSTISVEEFRARGMAFIKTRFECDGRLAWSFFQERELAASGVSRDQLGAFSSLLREVQGVDLAVFMLENRGEDGHPELTVSLRSSENFACLPIAIALGGGGHLKASGATVAIEDDIYETVEQVLKVARKGLAGELKG